MHVNYFLNGLNRPLGHLKGAESWFQHPPIQLQVRPQSTLCGLLPKGPVVQGFFWLNNSEPGSSPLKLIIYHELSMEQQ